MIDISHKRSSLRYARTAGILKATPEVIETVRNGKVPKGDVAATARSAGIQAAKRASDWIVFCHSIPLDWVDITMKTGTDTLEFTAEVRSVWKTGMEMEAMTAAGAALLNAYDMLKPLQDDIEIGSIRLVEKSGGKSDMTDTFDPPLQAGLLSVSNAKKTGRRKDKSGEILRNFLSNQPVELRTDELVEEDRDELAGKLQALSGPDGLDLILISGATGPTESDITPEVIRQVSDKLVPGIGEAMRHYGYERTPFAMHTDQVAGIKENTVMIALPGSSRGTEESLNALFPGLLHIFRMLRGR